MSDHIEHAAPCCGSLIAHEINCRNFFGTVDGVRYAAGTVADPSYFVAVDWGTQSDRYPLVERQFKIKSGHVNPGPHRELETNFETLTDTQRCILALENYHYQVIAMNQRTVELLGKAGLLW